MNSAKNKYTYLGAKPVKLIELQHVNMRRGERLVLDDVSLTVHRGDFIAITGPNGGGKTTLLRIMLRLLKPTRGEVIYHFDRKGLIGYLPQKNMIDNKFPITVGEVVASGLLALDVKGDELKRRVAETLDLMGLTGLENNNIGKLSGGQLQRAMLGRALISQPELLVLDEPLSYIDKKFELHFYDLLKTLAGKTTIVLVSHEMSAIAGMANRHVIIDRRLHECAADCHYVPTECE